MLQQDRLQYHKDKMHPTPGYSGRMVALEKKYSELGMLGKLQARYETVLNPKNPTLQERGEMKFYNHMGVTGDNVQEITPEREEAEFEYFAERQ